MTDEDIKMMEIIKAQDEKADKAIEDHKAEMKK